MRTTPLVVFLLLSLAGCDNLTLPPSQQTAPPVAAAPLPASAPASTSLPAETALADASRPIMATVNGRPIYMQQLTDPLVEAHGLLMAEMLVADALVEQEALARGIAVTEADVSQENVRSLRGFLGDQVNADQRERLLDNLLSQRGLTHASWDATMRRNALLRKMVQPQVVISDSMIKEEFSRAYGEKVQISHIQLPTLTEAEKILAMLNDKAEFADLARRYSTNTLTAKNGGALPAFTRDDASVPQAIREAAFALKENQYSGIVSVGESFNVLKLYKRTVPEQVSLETVQDKLRADLTERIVQQMQVNALTRLRAEAEVQFINPSLQKQASSVARAKPPAQP